MLFTGHTAEGHYNFTSTAEPSQKADVTEIESEMEEEVAAEQNDDDFQMLDQVDDVQRTTEVEHEQINQNRTEMEHEQINERMVATGARKNPQKEVKKRKNCPKKSSRDGMVGVMERYLEIKEKQAKDEATRDFSITKCIAVLKTMEGVTPAEKIKAFDVFKNAENREIFINAAADEDETALMWLHSQMEKL